MTGDFCMANYTDTLSLPFNSTTWDYENNQTLSWIYEFCPTTNQTAPYSWAILAGLMAYLFFFAPGKILLPCSWSMPHLTFLRCVFFHSKVWVPCPGLSTVKSIPCGHAASAIPRPHRSIGRSICLSQWRSSRSHLPSQSTVHSTCTLAFQPLVGCSSTTCCPKLDIGIWLRWVHPLHLDWSPRRDYCNCVIRGVNEHIYFYWWLIWPCHLISSICLQVEELFELPCRERRKHVHANNNKSTSTITVNTDCKSTINANASFTSLDEKYVQRL